MNEGQTYFIDVVYEDCWVSHPERTRREYVEVVVVVTGDGEVPHPAVVDLRDGAADYDRRLAVGGLEVDAGLEVTGG